MTTEIIKGIIAIIIVLGAMFALFVGDATAQGFLLPLAAFAFGYYFKQIELPIARKAKALLGK